MGIHRIRETRLKADSAVGSGGVRQYAPAGNSCRITQITTFCPDLIGPGATNLYLVESDALVLVDTGVPTYLAKSFFYQWRNEPIPPEIDALPPDQSERELREGLRLVGRSIKDIDLIVLSHGHLDHFMLGDKIVDESNARVAAHFLDTPDICNPWALIAGWFSRQEQIAAMGIPGIDKANSNLQKALDGGMGKEALHFTLKVDSPIHREGPLMLDGSPVDGIETTHIPGHTPGSVGLLVGKGKERVLISGDVLLYPITPHPDNLLVYLRTLDKFLTYDDCALVLPAHGKAIHNVKSRVEFLKGHHKKRLKATYDACARAQSVWDIAGRRNYFDTYVDPEKFNLLAGREALFHMELLAMADGLVRTEIRDGVHYFRNSREPFDEVYSRITDLVRDPKTTGLMRR
jgi:glyoxylase-like metal-dependent hydrolase (beta-lactamase superfamily II)